MPAVLQTTVGTGQHPAGPLRGESQVMKQLAHVSRMVGHAGTGKSGRPPRGRLSKLSEAPISGQVCTKLCTKSQLKKRLLHEPIERIGSSARTRTWNPSVNSRTLYH